VKAEGATSIATTRSRSKREELLALGADHVIVTDEENLVDRVKEITNKAGARIIFDPIGGPLVDQLAEAAAQGATIFEYGWLSGSATPFPIVPALQKGLNIRLAGDCYSSRPFSQGEELRLRQIEEQAIQTEDCQDISV
jgi:NADPH:quinone reductase-like Zn-dependent oxidoreductase